MRASFPRRLEIAWHQSEGWRCEREPFRSLDRNQADASFVYLSSLSLSLTHSSCSWQKKTCLPKRTGPRRTCLKLSLCVTGNSSVLLPLLELLTDLESGDSSYIAVTEVDHDKDFDHFQFHHEPPTTSTATSTSAKLFSRERGCCQGKI